MQTDLYFQSQTGKCVCVCVCVSIWLDFISYMAPREWASFEDEDRDKVRHAFHMAVKGKKQNTKFKKTKGNVMEMKKIEPAFPAQTPAIQ